jgi:stage II sporulation protein D
MLRREFMGLAMAAGAAWAQDSFAGWFENGTGTALVIDVAKRRTVAVHSPETAGRFLGPPGSTLKPLAIAALMEAGKLRSTETFRCPGRLEIGGRNLSCTHPPDLGPIQARAAIAYSCNAFVARMAERFEPGELTRACGRYGLLSRTDWLGEEAAGEFTHGDVRLQALGETGVLVTPAALALAYSRLAVTAGRAWMGPVLGGLEDAVEFGTAQRSRIEGVKVAGKTGSVRADDGTHLAWFAGFVPSTSPKFAVTVMLQGRSGGADAAPLAGKILEAAWRGKL